MTISKEGAKQKVTIRLSRDVLKKAKILAAKRGTSISGLLAQEIELLVGNEEAYKRAQRQALAPSCQRVSSRGRGSSDSARVT